MRRSLYLAFTLGFAACAQASGGGGNGSGVDAAVNNPRLDSSVSLVDAPVQSGPDAATPCTVITKNLLQNSAFDGSPAGVNWNATPIDPTYPIITADAGGVPAQSGTYRAWMGGIETTATANKDSLYQDVMIPASTTKLEFKGFYQVRTGELTSGSYDKATIELTNASNTQLELIQALDNNSKNTAWTAFGKVFTSAHAGMTVRVRFSSASDSTLATSFFYDTLELDATYCQ